MKRGSGCVLGVDKVSVQRQREFSLKMCDDEFWSVQKGKKSPVFFFL